MNSFWRLQQSVMKKKKRQARTSLCNERILRSLPVVAAAAAGDWVPFFFLHQILFSVDGQLCFGDEWRRDIMGWGGVCTT